MKISRALDVLLDPCCGVIKMNIDAALSNNATTIAVVAKDFKWVILKAWTKRMNISDPLKGVILKAQEQA